MGILSPDYSQPYGALDPAAMRKRALWQGLMQAGVGLMGQGPTPYPQGPLSGLGAGLEGFSRGSLLGMEDARRDQQLGMQERRYGLEEQKYGLDIADAQREQADEERQRTELEAAISDLPPDQQAAARINPNAFFKPDESQKPPTGMKMGPNGNWVWDEEYLRGKQAMDRAGAAQTTVTVGGSTYNAPKSILASDQKKLELGAESYEKAKEILPLFGLAKDAATRYPGSGTAGETRLAAQKVLQWLGVENNAPAGEVLKSVQTRLGVLQRIPGSGATSDTEMSLYMQAVPGLLNTQPGNIALAEIGEKLILRRMENFERLEQYALDTGTTVGFQVDNTPLLTPAETNLLMGAIYGGQPATVAPVTGAPPGVTIRPVN